MLSVPVFLQVCLGNWNSKKPPLLGPCCRTEQWGYNHLSQKDFQVFKNYSFDSSVISYFVMTETQGCLTVLNIFYLVIFIFMESLFLTIGNISRTHFQEEGWKIFLNVRHHEFGVKPYYCTNIGLWDYFEWNILSWILISLLI